MDLAKPCSILSSKTTIIPSPVGDLYCAAADGAVTHILYSPDVLPDSGTSDPVLEELRAELEEYFAGVRKTFAVPIAFNGTDHQRKVWEALLGIPYGETATYAQIASRVGSAAIAVGQAVGKNRINIVLPCHRVVGSDGSLTGYGGGLERKKTLLELERR
jgi:methylated-DNA-[protein]-cysteine S-methyltransferase